jgi:hypothetical protein
MMDPLAIVFGTLSGLAGLTRLYEFCSPTLCGFFKNSPLR